MFDDGADGPEAAILANYASEPIGTGFTPGRRSGLSMKVREDSAFDDDRRTWEAVADCLRAGRLGGMPAGPVATASTHGSLVAMVGEIALKLKRPVVFDALNYGTRARRKAMCERELEVNKPLGGDVYRGVRGIRRTDGGFELCEANDDACVEHVVVMRRVQPDERLDQRILTNDLRDEDIRALGHRLAVFHREAVPAAAGEGGTASFAEWAQGRIVNIRRARSSFLDPAQVEAAAGFLSRWSEANTSLLDARANSGHVRVGHGDLRLEHVVVDSGEVLDALEFNDSMRTQDVLADLSFLVMELQLAEREDLTHLLVEAWATAGGPLDESLLWAYASTKALVRVEVALDEWPQLERGLSQRVAEERAQTFLGLALRLGWRARVARPVVFAGLSGSGKTTISTQLAARWGLRRLSSDETRKRFVGLGRDDIAGALAYDDFVTKGVYQALGAEAGQAARAGRSVVVDATFRRGVDAQGFVRAYRGAGGLVPPVTVECIADDDELRRRVGDRSQLGGSDAGVDVLEAQLRDRAPFGVGISNSIPLPTDGSRERTLEAAEGLVLEATVG